MKNHFKIYTNCLIPERFAALTFGPFVFIRPQYRDDRGLLEHELVHVAQFWRTLGLNGLGYLFSKSYRLHCELEAYREQLRWYANDRAPVFAWFLADKYRLGISYDEALRLLTERPISAR